MLIDSSRSKPQRVFDFLHAHILTIIVGIVIISSLLSLVAIMTDKEEKKIEAENSNVVYEDINTLYFSMNNIKSLNPLTSKDEDTYYISQIVYGSLFTLDDKLNIKNDLVSKYSADAREATVSITLRNAKFSNGESLTADDVDYTIDKIKDLGSKSPYYSYVKKIDSVDVTGSKTLKIHFKKKYDAALDNLVFPIVSSSSYESDGSMVPGTGPYRYVKYNKQRDLTLKPNQYYFGEKAQGKIVFKFIKKQDAVPGLITADMVTAYVNKNSDADAVAEDKNLTYTPIVSSDAEYLGFNFKNKLLADKKMRQAIAYAIDTEKLIEDNYGGTAVTSDSIYYPGFMGVNSVETRFSIDQRASATLLEELDLKDTSGDGWLLDKKGKIISLTLLVNKNDDSRLDAATTIAEGLAKVGLKVKVRSLPWKEYLSALNRNDYDLYLGGYEFDKQYNLKSLFDKKAVRGYNGNDVQAYLDRMETCQSAEKQAETFRDLERLLADEVPYYCICYKTYGFTTVNHFESEVLPTFFNIYRGCEGWKWQKAVKNSDAEESGSNS